MTCLWTLWARDRCSCWYPCHIRLCIALSIVLWLLITLCVHHRFDGEVKEGAHGAFTTQETMKLPQTTWIETFLEGITDKAPDCPSSRSLPGLCTRSLVSCAQRLFVSTAGLSRGGFTLKRGIDSVRNWLRGSFALTQTWY
jgi:hypothetical protein